MYYKPLSSKLAQNPRLFFAMLIVVTAFGPAAIDFYLPAFTEIQRDFGTSTSLVQATLSSFFAAFVLGMLVLGPLSDRIGRRPVMIFGAALFLVATIGCSLAPSINWLIAFRFLQGLGACAGQTLCRSMISDRFDRNSSARTMSMVWMITAFAPLVAPLFGGWVLSISTWRILFGVIAVAALFAFILLLVALPETLPPSKRHPHTVRNISHSLVQISKNRLFLGYAGSCTAIMMGFFTYLGSAPAIYMGYFGISTHNFGWFFAVNVSGFIIGSFLNSKLVPKFGVDRMLKIGLRCTVLAALFLNLVVWSGVGGPYSLSAALLLLLGSAALVGGNAMAGGLAIFPKISGLASAWMGMVQFALGGIGVWLAGVAYDYFPNPRPMATMIFAVMAIGWMLHRWLVVPKPIETI